MNKKKAVFLDRDGVINKNKNDYVKTILELELFPSIEIPIKKLKNNGYLIIVITNQSALNRNLMNIRQLNEIHSYIQNYLSKFDVNVDKFYFCPHKPNENCSCRKPRNGMLIQAIKEFNIDPNLSWMIGDRDSDIQAGISIGCKTVKINNKINLDLAVDEILNS
jgi:histidinol-phosphate phosphatase family protein